jgi:enoyl-CoA hydratase
MPDEVLVERHDRVLVITINRPKARNAIDAAVTRGVAAALDTVDADDTLWLGVLTGAGGYFSAGMDLKAFVRGEDVTIPGRGLAGLAQAPPTKPLIAAVEGFALAGGFELALACDLIVASETATFGLPEVKRGLVAASGGLWRLPRRVPHHIAMEMLLTGDTLTAVDAYRHGLINRLTPPGEALRTALTLASSITANAPLAVRASKKVATTSPDWPASEAFSRQAPIIDPVLSSADALEGAQAFADKRPPRWRGK